MKVSSISGNAIDTELFLVQQGQSMLQLVQRKHLSLLNTINHIGTSIALGEKGDLDAAHEFRNKEYWAKK